MRRLSRLGIASTLAAMSVVGVLGCSALIDFNGLEGVPLDSAVGPDVVSVDAVGEGGPDGSGSLDSSVGLDAGADATFCDLHPGHTYCEDFDRETTPPTLDDDDVSQGLFSLDDGIHTSSPHSLRIDYPSGGFDHGHLGKALPSATKLTIDLQLRADYTFSSGQVIAIWVNLPLDSSMSGHSVYVESYGGPLRVIEEVDTPDGGSAYSGGDLGSTSTAGSFAHLVIGLDGAAAHYTVDLNGARIVDAAMAKGFPTGTSQFLYGDFANNVQSGDGVFHMDDVLIDAR